MHGAWIAKKKCDCCGQVVCCNGDAPDQLQVTVTGVSLATVGLCINCNDSGSYILVGAVRFEDHGNGVNGTFTLDREEGECEWTTVITDLDMQFRSYRFNVATAGCAFPVSHPDVEDNNQWRITVAKQSSGDFFVGISLVPPTFVNPLPTERTPIQVFDATKTGIEGCQTEFTVNNEHTTFGCPIVGFGGFIDPTRGLGKDGSITVTPL